MTHYTDVSQESPREACANLAQTFRYLASHSRTTDFRLSSEILSATASRLERAVQKLDAAQSPPEGPWRLEGDSGGEAFYVVRDKYPQHRGSVVEPATVALPEVQAIAVRDALNRLGAVPPAEHQEDQ